MVTKGQLLERPVIVPGPDGCLDGIFLRGGAAGVLVASPLPDAGGAMTNPLANEVAYAAAYAGRASLRLDYRGVGASEGARTSDLGALAADLAAGADFVLESTRGASLVVVGVASGAWAALALAAAEPRVDRVLLLNPPRRLGLPPGVPSYGALTQPLLIVLGDADPAVDPQAELLLTQEAGRGRVRVLPEAGPTLREALTDVSRLVTSFLGSERRPGGGAADAPGAPPA